MNLKEYDRRMRESNRDRFKRLATKRTNEILRRLRVLGNCANKSHYEYDERDISKIFSEIEKGMRESKARFQTTKEKEFKL
jgi:hypothetical protein